MNNKIFGNIKYISSLTLDDSKLFRDFFFKENLCHSNSWLYTLRTTRDDNGELGYKYWHQNSLIGIGVRNEIIYLMHPMGTWDSKKIIDLCRQISDNTDFPIILRRVGNNLNKSLINSERFTPVDNRNDLEDDAFPETIIRPSTIYLPNLKLNPLASKLLKKAKRFEHTQIMLSFDTSVKTFGENRLIEALLEMSNGIHDKFTSYTMMLKEVISITKNQTYYKSYIFYYESKIHGIYIVEFLNSQSVGLYCALTSKAFPGITEWIDMEFFRKMRELEIETVFLGGSETIGVYRYIDKLLPSFPNYQMHSLKFETNKR